MLCLYAMFDGQKLEETRGIFARLAILHGRLSSSDCDIRGNGKKIYDTERQACISLGVIRAWNGIVY